MIKVLELFSGTESFSKIARERGHKTFTIDNDKSFNPNLCIDILDFNINMLPEEFKHPDIIWASPPCVASISKHWGIGNIPKSKEALIGLKILEKTLDIIKELKPKYYVIENPRGMMRKFLYLHIDNK